MSSMPNQLSHFRIAAKLGEGGMGEVYRATDERLGREVAIKILPAAVTADAERLARLEREARILASLNHPNIAGLHDVGQAEGLHFLVMERVYQLRWARWFFRAMRAVPLRGGGFASLGALRTAVRLLERGQLVGVRGAGLPYDGLYFVQSVTSKIKRGEFKQSYTLTRNGLVSITPRVPA